MAYLEEKKFYFESQAPGLKADTFSVVRFSGTEAVSRLFEFNVLVMAEDPDIDLGKVLSNPATLYLRAGKELPVHGIVSNIEIVNEVDGKVFYRVVLSPLLWQLTLYKVSEVYLDMSVPEIIEKVLKEGGLSAGDYELQLARKYRKWSYVCQYQETHFDFISRWMEREGIYYYWQQGKDGAKLIITDSQLSHTDLPDDLVAHYSPPSGLGQAVQEQAVTQFLCRQVPLPEKVTLQDFNYRKSPPIVQGSAPVSAQGRGEVMIYGEHVKNHDEAKEYAKLRAEKILCREKIYHGAGTAAFLRVGYFFKLDRYFRDSFNRKYLMLAIRHEGSQAALLISGVQLELSSEEQRPFYRNTFEAIEQGLQFRPEISTPKPRFYGTINAKVSAEGDGKYAEVDEFGRYKVKLPFDRSDRFGQKASRWIRMAQPYAGPDEGMHFPLRKGAEVLLTFMDGDPDRPIIAAAVPGAEGQSVVKDENSTKNLIKTSGGNLMHFEDLDGKQRILMQSPTANSWVRIGAYNDPPSPYKVVEGDYLQRYSDSTGTWHLQTVDGNAVSGSRQAAQADNNKQAVYRLTKSYQVTVRQRDNSGTQYQYTAEDSNDNEVTLQDWGANSALAAGSYSIDGSSWTLQADETITAETVTKDYTVTKEIRQNSGSGNQYKYSAKDSNNLDVVLQDWSSNQELAAGTYSIDGSDWILPNPVNINLSPYSFPPNASQDVEFDSSILEGESSVQFYRDNTTTLNVQNPETVADVLPGNGIRIRSTDNLWLEANERFGDYHAGLPPLDSVPSKQDDNSSIPKIKDLLQNFGSSYNPSGLQHRHGGTDPGSVSNALAGAHVRVSSQDTFNTQEGNIYDFGGYWNYNLGNSYLEQFMDQSGVTLNQKQAFDKADAGGPNYTKITGLDGTATIQQNNHGTNVWVSKKMSGASYDYSSTIDSVEVKNVCNEITHKYGCYAETYLYDSDGQKFLETIDYEGDGIKYEKKWDRGLLVGYSAENDQYGRLAKFEWNAKAQATAEINNAASASFKLETEGKAELEIAVAASAAIKIEFNANFELTTGVGIGLELDLRAGGKFELKPSGGLKFEGMGFTGRKEAAIEAKQSALKAKNQAMLLGKTSIALRKLALDLKKLDLDISESSFYIFS